MVDHALPMVLVVDDKVQDLLQVRRRLRAANLANPILTFSRSVGILEYFQNSPRLHGSQRSILLVSTQMPGAFSILEWVSHHPDSRPTKVVALSNTAADAARAIAAGTDEFFVKFPAPGTLVRAVNALNPAETSRAAANQGP